ncbi:MAG: tryptophan--tRNA ligase [Silvanigrellales bacterium]|nr:tryptophan--tRNA ligase [Silvanigrellales bacterium]
MNNTLQARRPVTAHGARTRVLTGVKPTGDIHIGNYYGGIKPCVDLSQQDDFEVILMCADWHGLTNRAKILEAGEKTPGILAAYLALGFNLKGNALILQSAFPQILENSWYLSCVTSVGLLERAHAYKDALQNGKEPTGGLFYYPVLMASDIMTFDAEVVPVGKDQAQHLEYASDMGKSFNAATKKNVYFEPKALIQETPLLVGIDGERKMSKSYNNDIPLFGAAKDAEKRIKEIKTDSKGLDDVKDPETCVVFQMLKSFGSPEAVAHMKERLENGTGYGYGHAKKDLLDEYNRFFGAKRELYEHYLNEPSEVAKALEPGHEAMAKVADAVTTRARDALQLFPSLRSQRTAR